MLPATVLQAEAPSHVEKLLVPLHSQKDVEKCLTVQAYGEKASKENLTQGSSKPSPWELRKPRMAEWAKTQVRKRQIEEADIFCLLESFVFYQDKHNQDIVQEANYEHHGVEEGTSWAERILGSYGTHGSILLLLRSSSMRTS